MSDTRTCLREGCGGIVTFDRGVGSAVGNQPIRHHAACSECGAKHYLTENGVYALQG
jgi:hypothetical protein